MDRSRSSMVEHGVYDARVVGSIPAETLRSMLCIFILIFIFVSWSNGYDNGL